MVTLDVTPLLHLTREKVAQATVTAKTQARPMEHVLSLVYLTLKDLAFAFLDLVRSPTSFNHWLNSSED